MKKTKTMIVIFFSLIAFYLFFSLCYYHERHDDKLLAIAFTKGQLFRFYSNNKVFSDHDKFPFFFKKRLSSKIKLIFEKESINIYYSPRGFSFGDQHKWQILLTTKDGGFYKMRVVQQQEESIGSNDEVRYSTVVEYVEDSNKMPANIEKYKINVGDDDLESRSHTSLNDNF